ncbi:MAG: hypothetical protein WB711_09955 [Terriglobales bacterium]
MFRISVWVYAFFLLACCTLPMAAQQPAAVSANAVVPSIMHFNGVLTDVNGKPLTGTVGVTFFLYQDSQGGAPLWMETQNVQPDKTGRYSVMLGSSTSQGLPASVFASGEARWLGVQVHGQDEQPRVLLMSVPYAMKALDAETIGGKPASSFMLAPTPNSKAPVLPPGTITGSGTADFVPLFTGTTTIGNSKVFQTVGGDIGIATTTPAATLDVKGTGDLRDTLTLFPKSTHPTLSVHGTVFEVNNKGVVTFVSGQTFPGTGTVTSVGSGAGLTGGPITTSGTLSIKTAGVTNAMLAHSSLTVTANSPLTGGGAVSLGGSTSLGLKSCASGQILKWNGSAWACAADNNSGGTVTSITAGTGLTGGTITSSGTIAINTSVVPQLGASSNTFTGSQTIDGNLTVGGSGSFGGNVNSSGNVNANSSGGFLTGEFAETDLYLANTNPNCGLAIVALIDDDCGDIALEGDGANTFLNRPSGAVVEVLEAGATEAVFESGGELAVFSGSNRTFNGFNSSGSQTLQLNNGATPSNSAFIEAQFNENGTATFYTDTLGDTTATGSKSAVVPLQSGEMVKVFSMESPEVWFEDFGSGRLSRGAVAISLESKFSQTVDLSMGYHVFLTPKGDCKGLYVTGETNRGFEVRELGGGESGVEFDYRIVAHRKGYEAERMPVAISPVAGKKPEAPKPPVVRPGTKATGQFSAKLAPAGAVINKKK